MSFRRANNLNPSSTPAGLQKVNLGAPSRAMYTALMPHLPASSLISLCSHGAADYRGAVGDYVSLLLLRSLGTFAKHAIHLTHLQTLILKAGEVESSDFESLAALLKNLTCLTEVDFHLQEYTANPRGATAPYCSEHSVVALCESLRSLPKLQIMRMQPSFWVQRSTVELLFQPSDFGCGPDACWGTLTILDILPTPNMNDPRVSDGAMLSYGLCCAERLEQINLNCMEVTEDSVSGFFLRSDFPFLRRVTIGCIMTNAGAQALGRAISSWTVPCLETFLIEFLDARQLAAVRIPPNRHDVNDRDGAQRCIMHGLGELQLPSIKKLALTSSLYRPVCRSAGDERARVLVHAPHARLYATALANVLRSQRLQELNLYSMDLTSECMQIIAPCMGALHSLTHVEFGALEIDSACASVLLNSMRGHTALEDLLLVGATIKDSAVDALSKWLVSLPGLRELTFDECQFGTAGLDTMKSTGTRLQKVLDAKFQQCVCVGELADS